MKDLRNELIATLKSENKALKELVSIYRSQNITIQEPQLKEVEEAGKRPIVFDEDCEELSPAMMKAFKCAVAYRNRRKNA